MRKRKWSQKKQTEFFIQCSRLLVNGFDLLTALKLIQGQHKSWHQDIKRILQALYGGKSFRQSLMPFISQQIIDEMIFVELHGQLLPYLNILGRRERKRQQYIKKFWQLAFYPLFLLVLISLLSVYFVQQFSKTILLGSISGWLWATMGCLLLVITKLAKERKLLQVIHKLPILKKFWLLNLQSQLCFQMGWLLKSGINVTDILLVLNQHPHLKKIPHYEMLKRAVIQALDDGAPLVDILKFMPLLPADIQLLFESGQTVTQLSDSLLMLAKELQRSFERKVLMYLQLVQPVLFMTIGLAIIFLYQNYLLPSYQIIGGGL